jgi:hypothetical protein
MEDCHQQLKEYSDVPGLFAMNFLSENIGGDGDCKENTTKYNCRNTAFFILIRPLEADTLIRTAR